MRSELSRVRYFLLGLVALVWTSAAPAGVGEWTSSGPAGSTVYSLAASRSEPSKVFAFSQEGLLRSTDGGVTWVNVNTHTQSWHTLTIPQSSSSLFALTSSGVARSDDEGITWTQSNVANGVPLSLAVAPSGSTLYAGTGKGVFKSSDGGLTWSAATEGMPERYIEAVAVDPSNPSIVYASGDDYYVSAGDIFRSTDAGRSWTLKNALGYGVSCLVVDPTRTTTIYGCSQSGLIRSLDAGATWSSFGLRSVAYSIVFDPLSAKFFVSTQDGLYHGSGYSGWTPVQFGPEARESSYVPAMAIVSSSPTALLVATRSGLLRSTDSARSWTVLNTGGRARILSVAVSPATPGSVYAGGDGGVFRSTDAGASWTPADLSSPMAYALAAPTTDGTVFAAGIGISSSRDGGATWVPLKVGFDPGTNPPITALAASPSDPSVLLAGSMSGILYQSGDAGESWRRAGRLPMDDSGYPPVLKSFAFDPSNEAAAYAAGDGLYGEGAGVFKAMNGVGADWSNLGVVTSGALSVLVDPRAPATIYLATREGLRKSLDGGGSWTSLPGPTGPLVMDPTSSTTLYVAGNSRVFRSIDAGLSWKPLNQQAVAHATSLAITPDGKRLYAGTENGVFDYALSEETNGSCKPSVDSLCLLGGRFQVSVLATDLRRNRTSTGFAVAQDDRFGYFSLPEFTGDATLPEVFIKMVDGSWLPNGAFWVFYNGLTSLPYTIVVTDTSTGQRRVYTNDGACGGADTSAFPAAAPGPQAIATARATSLSASGVELSLLGDRFRVTLSATHARTGRVTTGSAIAQGDRFGYFSLPDFTGDANLPEVCVKMVDATSFNGNFWFFHTSLTSVSYTLTVTDSVTGAVETYENGASHFCGGSDTTAFSR